MAGRFISKPRLKAAGYAITMENGVLKSELETRIGTDENKIFIKVHADHAESQQAEYDAKVLYSRNVADFWDVQAGLRYRNDQNREVDQDQVDAVIGVHGLAPYFLRPMPIYMSVRTIRHL